jgi:uncharacterized protein YqgC (DUF456 family)
MPVSLRNTRGLALIALGLVAMLIPIVPGLPLVTVGAALLGPNHHLIRFSGAWLQKRGFLKDRNPKGSPPQRLVE